MADLEKIGFELDEDEWIKVTKENAEKMIFPKHRLDKVKKVLCVDEQER